MIGARLTLDRDGVMVGVNDTKFGKKRSFGKLAVGNKNGKEAEGKVRGEGGRALVGEGRVNGILAMDANL